VYYQKGQYCREPVFLGGRGRRRRRRRRRETASPFLSEAAAAKQETLTSVGKWEQAHQKFWCPGSILSNHLCTGGGK
jgi:hypothetical protein